MTTNTTRTSAETQMATTMNNNNNNNHNDKDDSSNNNTRRRRHHHHQGELSSSSSSLTTNTQTTQTQQLLEPPPKKIYPQWHNGIAGGVAGAGARLCTAPFDLLRIRRQLSATMSKESMFVSLYRIARAEGGIPSLFRGNVAATYLWIGYSSIQFTLYEQTSTFFKNRWIPSQHNNDNDTTTTTTSIRTMIAFISGATAGVCATTITYPFDLTRTIFAARGLQPNTNSLMPVTSNFRPPRTLLGFAHSLYQTKGWAGFYAGSTAAILQIIPYMGLNFAIYDVVLRYLKSIESQDKRIPTPTTTPTTTTSTQNTTQQQQQPYQSTSSTTTNTFLISSSVMAGAMAGGISKFVVYPMDTVKKRLQAQAAQCSWRRYKGLVDCLVTMTKQEGIPSLYKGLYPSLAKNMSATAISFTIYTFTKDILQKIHDSSS